MSEYEMNISLPLDSDGFFRRECPLCRKEFKLLLEKDELADLAQKGIDSFMLEREEAEEDSQSTVTQLTEFTCPYCGQLTTEDSWWTQEQLAYIGIFVKNIMAKMVNEQFIRPLKRDFGRPKSGLISVQFEGREIKQQEPWISPETDDMDIFTLSCCQRKMKIIEGWKGKVHCFFCGFPHSFKTPREIQ